MKYLVFVFMLIIPFTVDAYTPSETARQVISSLKAEPDHWFNDQYRMYYFKDKTVKAKTPKSSWEQVADCTIWIANGAFGIEIQSPMRVKFEKKNKEIIWKIYQQWATGHFADNVFSNVNNVFSNLEGSEESNEPQEQIIKLPEKKEQLLTSVSDDKPTPVDEKPSCAFWELIALIEGILILLGIMVGVGTLLSFKNKK